MTCEQCKANKVCDHNLYGFENCGNYIPLEVVEVKSGHIIEHQGHEDEYYCECSVCGSKEICTDDKFCSECGAKLDGVFR